MLLEGTLKDNMVYFIAFRFTYLWQVPVDAISIPSSMTLTVKMLFLNVNASFPVLSSFGMDVGVGFLERNNIWPVFFLFEKMF